MKKEKNYICIISSLIFVMIIVMNMVFSDVSKKKNMISLPENDHGHPSGGIWYITPTPKPTQESTSKSDDFIDDFKIIRDCKWSKDEQKKVKKICEKYGIPFEICIAQAFVESSWNEKAEGDNGKAYGAWQIHPTVWKVELKKWGYSWDDMYDLEKACDVYCRIMKSHFMRYDNLYFALMAWRWGGDEAMEKLKNGPDNYALKIVKIKNKLR